MSDEVKKTPSQLKAEAIAAARSAIEWAKDKSLEDQQAARDQLAAAQRMPDDPPEAKPTSGEAQPTSGTQTKAIS